MISELVLKVLKPNTVDWRIAFMAEVHTELDVLCRELSWKWVKREDNNLQIELSNGHIFQVINEEGVVRIKTSASRNFYTLISTHTGLQTIAYHITELAKKPQK